MILRGGEMCSITRVSSFKQFTRVEELTGSWEEALWMIHHTLWQIDDTPPRHSDLMWTSHDIPKVRSTTRLHCSRSS
jgi:hypothetical protein